MTIERTISIRFVLRLGLAGLLAALLSAPFALNASAGNSGIQRLVAVSQLKAQNANEEALDGADKQRDLVNKQKKIREQQKQMQDLQTHDRLGNMEIQRLMSQRNQEEQTASSVQKKDSDSEDPTIKRTE